MTEHRMAAMYYMDINTQIGPDSFYLFTEMSCINSHCVLKWKKKNKIFDISLQTSVFNAEFTGFQKEG